MFLLLVHAMKFGLSKTFVAHS